ncbi:MAG: PHB depolymerase family esterase [Vulcanimicrobiota bacterium]
MSKEPSSCPSRAPSMLFVPESGRPQALLLMLHGCTQNPADFARGTRMNDWARRGNFAVLYPEQTRSANPKLCWNWFSKEHQQAGAGEPASLMELVRSTQQQLEISPDRIFLAGLSAGACMSAILAARYPAVFAGVGLHSGVPLGAASSVVGALLAMRGLSKWTQSRSWNAPTLIFQGDRDKVVSLKNADRLAIQAGLGPNAQEEELWDNGRRVRRSRSADARVERWLVEGLGHAWSGGSLEGSWTDPEGPDASAQIVRFFGIGQ